MNDVKEFLLKYKVGESDILMVQMIANDVPRTTMAERIGIQYKTLCARINKLRVTFGVKSDVSLTLLFYKNKLID